MDIDLLRTFQRVAQLQSISKAADDLFLSISTVTGRIRALEEELGISLFHRSGRKIELSGEGKHFLEYVDRFMSILHEGNQKIKLFREGESGELSVAVSPIAASYVLPKFIQYFRQLAPKLQLRLVCCPNFQVIDKVNNGQAEIGITIAGTEETGHVLQPWFQDEWIVVLPSTFDTSTSIVAPSDLRDMPLMCFGKDTQQWEIIRDWYQQGGVNPRIMMELEHVETIKELMKEFRAAAFLPSISVNEVLTDGSFRTAKLLPPPEATYQLSFVYLNAAQLSAAALTFITAATSYAAAHLR